MKKRFIAIALASILCVGSCDMIYAQNISSDISTQNLNAEKTAIFYQSDFESEGEDVLSAPLLENNGNGIFSRTVESGTYVKFIPETDGEYTIKRTYTEDSENTFSESIFDADFDPVDTSDYDMNSVTLKKGNVYYIKPFQTKSTVTAEYIWPIKSVTLLGNFKTAVYYTPVNFWQTAPNTYALEKSPWHGQKLKITYTNEKTESIDIYKRTHYGQYIHAYIKDSGNKSAPQTGTYDVHFQVGASGAETILKKGIQVKTLSQMPVITGKGSKVIPVTGSVVYGCLKTTNAGKYTITCKDWDDESYFSVSQLKNGELTRVLTVQNGKSCTLKANSIYYIDLNIHSGAVVLDNVTFSVSPVINTTPISKAKISVGTLSYTGANVKPSVTVKNGAKTLRKNTDYTISYTKASKVGSAVKVTINGKGNYSGKMVKTAYIVPAKPVISSTTGGKKKLTVSYKKTVGATGYQIAYSTSQNKDYKYINAGKNSSKKTISKLRSGKKYYVKVRAYKTINGKKYYGNYSKTTSVKVK